MNNRRPLPALDNAKKLNDPDLTNIGNRNYTDTILRYGGLATKFPQLHTEAKTIIEAINEIADNPPIPPTPPTPPTPVEGPEYYLIYESMMGWHSTNAIVQNNGSNLLGVATSKGKDLLIEVKPGSGVSDELVFKLYWTWSGWSGEFMRFRLSDGGSQFGFQFGGDYQHKITTSFNPEYPLVMRIKSSDHSMHFYQNDIQIASAEWRSNWPLTPFTTIDGATSIYCPGPTTLEFLKVGIE